MNVNKKLDDLRFLILLSPEGRDNEQIIALIKQIEDDVTKLNELNNQAFERLLKVEKKLEAYEEMEEETAKRYSGWRHAKPWNSSTDK